MELALAPADVVTGVEQPYVVETLEPSFEWDIMQAQTVVWLQREYLPGRDMRLRQTG